MGANRLWAGGTAVLVLLILAGTYLLGVAPQLGATDRAIVDLSAVETQNKAHEDTLESLEEQFEDIDELKSVLEELRLSVPEDREETPLIQRVGDWAINRGVFMESIEFDAPVAWIPTETTDPELADAMAQVTEGRFLVLPVRLQGTAPDGLQLLDLLDDIQHGERLLLVNEVTVEAVDQNDPALGMRLSVTGQLFVLTADVNGGIANTDI